MNGTRWASPHDEALKSDEKVLKVDENMLNVNRRTLHCDKEALKVNKNAFKRDGFTTVTNGRQRATMKF